MRIAQIAPLIESVPPRFYGGTERVVSYLTEELVRLGHDVTLFASGDSVTFARLVSCATTALRLDPKVRDPIPYSMLMLDRVRECTEDFGILHFHIDYYHFRGARFMVVGWTALRTVASQHLNNAWKPRQVSAAYANQIRNTRPQGRIRCGVYRLYPY